MIISKEALDKIKKIINKNYKSLLINVLGRKVFTEEELKELEKLGVGTSNETSLLSLIYYHNVLNPPDSKTAPTSISDMLRQQQVKPSEEAHKVAEDHLNESLTHWTERLSADAESGIEAIIRDNNIKYRNNALQNLDRSDSADRLVMESTIGGLKQVLRDYSGDADKDWERVAVTSTSEALSMGSADRIIMQNRDKDLNEVYVYKIVVKDAALCKYCRKFFLDNDNTPVVYKLTTLLNNGNTNYGRKAPEWLPVIGPIHPRCRESGILELRPGWAVKSDGALDFIGQDKWPEYIDKKVRG